MMEARLSARRVSRQLDRSDCVERRCWDQWIREKSFTRKPDSGRFRQISTREDRHNRCPLRELPLTPTHQRLRFEWCPHEETGLQRIETSSFLVVLNPDSISAVMKIVLCVETPW
ncbi:HTH_Tnp_Tc3_2 domain-containing protein [Trichonephila clavipes]|nr:HTH_Tnp_Tc3_2 domain-containing protein [Trichonephila clavipes]